MESPTMESLPLALDGMVFEKKLQSAADIHERYPVLPAHRVDERREEIRRILDGRDSKRLMAIVGPCSAWPFDAVRTYADNLARLQEDVREKLLLVMRCYIQKPRTTVGWSGPLTEPDPQGPPDIPRGIELCSKLMQDVGQQLPLADEMLFTHNDDYFVRYLSYVAIGARSAEDADHRYVASGFGNIPAGVKNTTGGDIEIGANGVLSVQSPHVFPYRGYQTRTKGDPYAHLILRGGGGRSNYDPKSIAEASHHLDRLGVRNPSIIVDTSHDNSHNGHGKDPDLQMLVVDSILSGIRHNREEYERVRGFMIESFLKRGKQKDSLPQLDMDGLSITDPCLGWEQTEQLLREAADQLDRRARH